MKRALASSFFSLPLLLCAQLTVPVGLQLTGANEADRQVTGLATPVQPDAAVSLDAARSGATTTAVVSGTEQLTGTLTPAPSVLTPGMLVTVIPTEANGTGASLELNELGAYPVVKWGSVPVDSADLAPGVPSRMLFDGARFLLLNNLARPCPTGSSPGGALFCISDSSLAEGSYYDGVNACESRGGRLCSYGEWASACRRNPGFLSTVSAYEWVDDAANSSSEAKTVGGGYDGPNIVEGFACEYGFSREPLLIFRYRCCFDR